MEQQINQDDYNELFISLVNVPLSYMNNSNDSLDIIVKCAGITPKPKGKTATVDALYEFYCNENSAAMLYCNLNEYERDLLRCIVRNNYKVITAELSKVKDAHNFESDNSDRWGYYTWKRKYFHSGSKLYAFFIKDTVPPLFKAYLGRVIPPYVRTFKFVTYPT